MGKDALFLGVANLRAHVRHPIVAQTIATLREYRLRRHPTAVGDRSRRTLQKYQMHFTMCVIWYMQKSFDAKYTPRARTDRTPDWRREDSGNVEIYAETCRN